jgi:hypothetical protein
VALVVLALVFVGRGGAETSELQLTSCVKVPQPDAE